MTTEKYIQLFTRFLKKHNAYCLYRKNRGNKNSKWWFQNRPEEYIINAFIWNSMHPVSWSMLHRQWLRLIKENIKIY
jgi:hypothetical protein